MTSWLLALAAGLGFAAAGYAGRGAWRAARAVPAALRALAITLLVALALDAPMGPSRPGARLLALDTSVSMARGNAGSAWRRALVVAESIGGRPILVGDLPLEAPVPDAPRLPSSRMAPLVERARVEGRAVSLVTDGEIDDPEVLLRLPQGSSVHVVRATGGPDLAIATLESPATAITGDTVTVHVGVVAGPDGATPSNIRLSLDATVVGDLAVPALAAHEERVLSWRTLVASTGTRVVAAWKTGAADAESRNDSLRAVLDVLARPAALVVSTAPDADARWLDAGVRSALGTGVRTWWRVAPGEWRESPSLNPVAERDVRRGVAEANLVVLHGDTAFFGPPATAMRAARWLVAPPEADGEWYVAAPPTNIASPLSDLLGGISRDSLPPLLAAPAPSLSWTALVAQRDKRGDGVPVLTGTEGPPRVAVLSAAGYSRWGSRGGESGDALSGLVGAFTAWLAEAAPDSRSVVPSAALWREGEPLGWRRAGRDSLIIVRWTRDGGANSGADTLRFSGTTTQVSGRAWGAGAYRVEVPGGTLRVIVNASREWVPRRPVAVSGVLGTAAASATSPTARGAIWLIAVAVAALCVEWWLRRSAGLR